MKPRNPTPAGGTPDNIERSLAVVNLWKRFTPPGERCSVEMPGVPKSIRFPGMTAAYQVEWDSENLAFLFGWADLPGPIPPALVDQELEEAVGETARTWDGTVQGKQRITVAGLPGIEFTVQARRINGIFVTRYLIANQRIYFLAGGGKSLQANSMAVRHFLESFRPDANQPVEENKPADPLKFEPLIP
jgi:hypothetical protein